MDRRGAAHTTTLVVRMREAHEMVLEHEFVGAIRGGGMPDRVAADVALGERLRHKGKPLSLLRQDPTAELE